MEFQNREAFIEKRANDVLTMPVHKHFGLKLIRIGDGEAESQFTVGKNAITSAGSLHGGILYILMEGASLFSLISRLETTEHAVSHSVSFSLMNPAFEGDDIMMKSRVMKRGKRVAFMNVEAWTEKEGTPVLIASGQVTKSLVPAYD